MSNATTSKKTASSGLRKLAPGEILFNDGDKADSLYILQKGQLRLFKPKGKGFIEIAVLRAGEVIGEMAYFDSSAGGGKRSCSASAMVNTEVIEISFAAFGKTMASLNPWFKTIIHTLADRLRVSNTRVKELESNSTSMNYATGVQGGYEFFKTHEVIKILGTLFLVFKAHGEERPDGLMVGRRTLDLYSKEIYSIFEAKLEEMLLVLEELDYLKIENDKDGLPKVLVLKKLEGLRGLFIFCNTEKHLAEDKKLKISPKCQLILEQVWEKIRRQSPVDGFVPVEIRDILEGFKQKGQSVGVDDLFDARNHGIVGEVIVDEESLTLETAYLKLKKLLPCIQFLNRLSLANRQKSNLG